MPENHLVTVQYLEVDTGQAGQRLDNFLSARLKDVPKSRVYRLLRKGEVRVNKGRAKPGYRVQVGDIIRIPPLRRSSERAATGYPPQLAASLQTAILLESEELLVIDKPAGIAVHGGTGLRFGLIDVLRASQPRYADLALAHRLDRGTSGCLLLAKDRPTLLRLHQALRAGQIVKTYMALLRGNLAAEKIIIDTALKRDTVRSGERMVQVSAEGKTAYTELQVMQRYATATLVQLRITTGRTHQIRVHCASINHPLAGDEKYGDNIFNKTLRGVGLKRLFLHAQCLQFELDKPVAVTAPLPAELHQVLQALSVDSRQTTGVKNES